MIYFILGIISGILLTIGMLIGALFIKEKSGFTLQKLQNQIKSAPDGEMMIEDDDAKEIGQFISQLPSPGNE